MSQDHPLVAASHLDQGLAHGVLQLSLGDWWVGSWGGEGCITLGITEAPGQGGEMPHRLRVRHCQARSLELTTA